MCNILIIDDEREVGNFLYHLLSMRGFKVTVVYNGTMFNEELKKQDFQLAMIDVKLPDTNGLDLLRVLKTKQPQCKAVIMTGFSTVQTAVDAIKLGASDYIEKPFDDIDQLEALIDDLLLNEVSHAKSDIEQLARKLDFIVGKSESMNQLVTMAYKIARKNINVLIEGETGTGKEVLARFIHHASMRQEETFIGVNCGALSETLLESELFGHEKGSFTGATQLRKGLFEIASQGTLFLDEIAEASSQIQVKLLRILESREFMRVGSERILRTNARILAASHVNLEDAVGKKYFREDLLYRLNVVKLTIPPLRERKQDLELLISFLLSKQTERSLQFSSEALEVMQKYEWPGNIRELSNVITRAVTLAEGETDRITTDYLPNHIRTHKSGTSPTQAVKEEDTLAFTTAQQPNYSFDETRSQFEQYLQDWNERILSFWTNKNIQLEEVLLETKQLEKEIGKSFVMKALRETVGNRKEAAEQLNISQRKLRYLLNEKGHSSS